MTCPPPRAGPAAPAARLPPATSRRVIRAGAAQGALVGGCARLLEHGDRVVAWDPILSGADYVAGLRALSRELEEARDDTAPTRQERSAGSEELAGYHYAEKLLRELEDLDLDRVVRDRRFDRLVLITGSESDRTAATRSLRDHAADITGLTAKPAHWASASRFERSLTPFPSLTELCETVSRW